VVAAQGATTAESKDPEDARCDQESEGYSHRLLVGRGELPESLSLEPPHSASFDYVAVASRWQLRSG
jgi:hypothetical protein